MKITTWDKTSEIDLGEEATRSGIDVNQFAKALRVGALGMIMAGATISQGAEFGLHVERALKASAHPAFSLAAAAESGAPKEVTGEDIEALVLSQGGTVVAKRDANGVIEEIHASFTQEVFEYDADEMQEVIDSLHATAPAPAKIVGDLAQTSVGVPGSGTEQQVIGLSEWTIDWKRKTADATTTDNSTYESSLPSTASWSVKAKYMYIDQDTSQQAQILATLNSPATPPTWNFFPTIATGRAAWSGQAYVDGITISSGMGKTVGLDVSLKGTGPLYQVTQLAPVANTNTVTGEQAED